MPEVDKAKAIAGGALATSGLAVLGAEHWDTLLTFANYNTLGASLLLVGAGVAAASKPKTPASFSSFFSNDYHSGDGGGSVTGGGSSTMLNSGSGSTPGAPAFKFTLLNEHFDDELKQLDDAASSGRVTAHSTIASHPEQNPSSRCGRLLLSIHADVRSADDVVAFEGRPRNIQPQWQPS